MQTFSLAFDQRRASFGAPTPELYAAALEMAEYADRKGFDRMIISEHHGAEDGYLPSPFVFGGGIAARTKKARICLAAVLAPLRDPVNIAEDAAVLDLVSGGRLEIVLGAGYVPSEFARFRVSMRERGRLLDEGIEIILRALAGERFRHGDREIYVRPLPIQDPRDLVWCGGGVEASAKRAAKFDIPFMPVWPALTPVYTAECERLGRKPRRTLAGGQPLAFFVSENPKKAWDALEPYMLHVVQAYARMQDEGKATTSPFTGMHDREALKSSGVFDVFTPQECVERIRKFEGGHVMALVQPLLGGLPPKIGWECLELFAEKVLPEFASERA